MHGNRDLISQVIADYGQWLLHPALLTSLQQANPKFEVAADALLDEHFDKCHSSAVKFAVQFLKRR